MERASTAAIERATSWANANFTIESIAVFGTTVTIELKNTRSTSATDYTHMDFIADYIGETPSSPGLVTPPAFCWLINGNKLNLSGQC